MYGLLSIGVLIPGIIAGYEEYTIIYLALFPFIPSVFGMDVGFNIPYISLSRLFLILIILVGIIKGKLKGIIKDYPLKKIFGIFILLLIISVINSQFPVLSLNSLMGIIIEWVFLSALAFKIFDVSNKLEMFVYYFSILFFISVLIGLAELVFNYNPIYNSIMGSVGNAGENTRKIISDYSTTEALNARSGFRRIQSVFSHPYFFSNMGVFAFFIFGTGYQKYKNNKYVLLIVLALITIFMGLSRVTLVFYFATLITYLIINNKQKHLIRLLLIPIPIILLLIFYYSNELLQIFITVNDPGKGSTIDQRIMMLKSGFEFFQSNLLFGVGLQVPTYILANLRDNSTVFNDLGYLEITWLNWLVSVGIFALICLWYIYYKFIKLSFKAAAEYNNYFSKTIIALIIGAFINDLLGSQINYSFLFVLGAISIKEIKDSNDTNNVEQLNGV